MRTLLNSIAGHSPSPSKRFNNSTRTAMKVALSIIVSLALTGCESSAEHEVIITSNGQVIDTVHSGESKEFQLGQNDEGRQEAPKPDLQEGYIYSIDDNSINHFKYTREFQGDEADYVTIYKIYDPQTGGAAINIIAHHYKATKKVTVDAKYSSGVLPQINTEETSYEEPTDTWFGKKGTMRVLGGNNIPVQIGVKFFDKKHEHVIVKEIAGSHLNGLWDKFFVLNDH